jgi:hypothetical protein
MPRAPMQLLTQRVSRVGGVSLIVAPKISKDPSKSKKWAKRSYLPGDL